jgi:dihydrofolate reductase
MSVSLDGYVNGPDGTFGWTEPDEQLSRFVNDVQSRVGIYFFGRRVFETMRVWEDDAALAGLPDYLLEYAPIYRAAEKVVFSTAMEDPALPRTRVERRLDADAVRGLKESTMADLAVAGPTLAADFLRAGLVDELTLISVPVVVGAGTRFLPDRLSLRLSLVEERSFASGSVFLRYAVQR